MCILAENHLLVPRLHTIGVNHGAIWASGIHDLRDIQPVLCDEVSQRQALRNIVFGAVMASRDDFNKEWRFVPWAPSKWWPWLSNRNEGDYGLPAADM